MNTLPEFRRWVQAQPAHSVVGYANVPYNNPLANWLDDNDLEADSLFTWSVSHCVARDGVWVRDLALWEESLLSVMDLVIPNHPITRESVLLWIGEEPYGLQQGTF